MDQEKIGKFILFLRKEKGLTQTELGEMVGVSDKAVSKWERGICIPDSTKLNSVASVLGITSIELLNGEKNPDINEEKMISTIENSVNYYNNQNKRKYYKYIFLIILSFLIFIFFLLILFAFNNYGKCTIYEYEENELVFGKGNIIITNNNVIISLMDLNVVDDSTINEKGFCFEYSLFLDDILIVQNGNVNLYKKSEVDELIELNSYIDNINLYLKNDYANIINDNRNLKKIKLNIRYIDESDNIKNYEIKFDLNKTFTNNKFIYSS